MSGFTWFPHILSSGTCPVYFKTELLPETLYSKKRINYLMGRSGTIQMIQNGVPKNSYSIEKIQALEK
ncbi:MAG: hypothetical protein RRA15_08045 [bacterium]|nr:hypothetical protein [bacterium]